MKRVLVLLLAGALLGTALPGGAEDQKWRPARKIPGPDSPLPAPVLDEENTPEENSQPVEKSETPTGMLEAPPKEPAAPQRQATEDADPQPVRPLRRRVPAAQPARRTINLPDDQKLQVKLPGMEKARKEAEREEPSNRIEPMSPPPGAQPVPLQPVVSGETGEAVQAAAEPAHETEPVREISEKARKEALKHYNQAGELGRKGEMKEAVLAYQKAIMINPNLADAYVGLAAAYGNMGRWQLAVTQLQKALANGRFQDPFNRVQAHFNLGAAYCFLDQPAMAETEYRAVAGENHPHADRLRQIINQKCPR